MPSIRLFKKEIDTFKLQQFVPQQQQQQFVPQQQQQQQALPLPGSGKSLFDQIVNRINTGHRDNARRKQQNQVCWVVL